MAHDVGDAFAQRPGEQLAQVGGDVVGGAGQVGPDLGGPQCGAGPGQLGREAELAHPVDGAPDVGEGDEVRLPDGSAGVVYYANLPVSLGVRTTDGLYRFIYSGAARGDAIVLGHQNFAGRDEQAAWEAWMAERLG